MSACEIPLPLPSPPIVAGEKMLENGGRMVGLPFLPGNWIYNFTPSFKCPLLSDKSCLPIIRRHVNSSPGPLVRSLARSSSFSMETLGPTIRLASDINLHKRRRAILHVKSLIRPLTSPAMSHYYQLESYGEINSFLFSLSLCSVFTMLLFKRIPSRIFSPPPLSLARKTSPPPADVDFRTFTAVITDKRRYNYPGVGFSDDAVARSIIAIIVSWLTYFRHEPVWMGKWSLNRRLCFVQCVIPRVWRVVNWLIPRVMRAPACASVTDTHRC